MSAAPLARGSARPRWWRRGAPVAAAWLGCVPADDEPGRAHLVPEPPDVAQYVDCAVVYEEALDAEGLPSFRAYGAYGADGFLARLELDREGDGRIDLVQRWSDRSAYGLAARFEEDDLADPEGSDIVEAGVDGHLTLWQTFDYGADGQIDARTRTTAANGVVLSLEFDDGDDGVVDERSAFAYDGGWREVRQVLDLGADGVTDAIRQTVWDDANSASRTVVTTDTRGHVTVANYAYDGPRLMVYTSETAADGLEIRQVYTYVGDQPAPSRRTESVWVHWSWDHDAVTSFEYDADGRPTSEAYEVTYAQGGVSTQYATWEWDCP